MNRKTAGKPSTSRRPTPRKMAARRKPVSSPAMHGRPRHRPADKELAFGAPGVALRLAVAGYICFDLVMKARQKLKIPRPNALERIDEERTSLGGPGGAAAVAAALLGAAVEFVGMVGKDFLGEILLGMLQDFGVGTSAVKRRGCSGATSVLVEAGGERRFIACPGANALLDDRSVDFAKLEKTSGLHVSGIGLHPKLHGKPLARLLRRAQAAGLFTSVDFVHPGRMRKGGAFWMVEEALPFIGLLTMSMSEAPYFTGQTSPEKAAAFLRRHYEGPILIKMGEEGMLMLDAGATEPVRIPAYTVEVADTTGAGDVSSVAAALGLLEGMTLQEAARFACAAGALVVKNGKGVTGAPTRKQVLDFMRRNRA